MHFELPKPLQGWREFAKQVGTIVLGVLIALGADQLVSKMNSRHWAHEARSGIYEELGANAGVFEERALAQLCLDRRLNEIDSVLKRALQTHALPDIGDIGHPPVRPTLRSAWDEEVGSHVLDRLSEHQRMATIYAQAQDYIGQTRREMELWGTLRMIEDAPGPVSDPFLTEAISTLNLLRTVSWFNGKTASQEVGSIGLSGIKPTYGIIFDRPGTRAELVRSVRARDVCSPLMVDGKPWKASR
jgi:hypothetical protein